MKDPEDEVRRIARLLGRVLGRQEHQATPPADPYRDSTRPERRCDRCGRAYRGPAVYCSLTCALADA